MSKSRRGAQFLLTLLAPADCADEILGDLEERYLFIAERFGEPRARLWYCMQAISCAWWFASSRITNVGTAIVRALAAGRN